MVALLAALSACSSNGGGSHAGSDSSALDGGVSGTVNAPGTPIKVGVICMCSGVFGASVVGASEVAQAWAKNVNATGGIDGHPVDLDLQDDQGNPGTSTTIAQKMISEGVAVILNLTGFDAAWATNVAAAKIPVVGGIYQDSIFGTNPYFYPTGQSQASAIASVASVAKQAGARNLGVLYCAESTDCQQIVGHLKTAGQRVGVPEVYSAAVAATAPNYTAQCLAAQQAKVEAIVFAGDAKTAARIGSDCDRQGYAPTFLMQGLGYSKEFREATGFGKSLWMPFPMLPYFADVPAMQKMNAAVDKYYPDLRAGDDVIWAQLGAQTWAAGILIEHAVKASGADTSATVDAATMLKGLNSIKGDDLDGLTSPLTFTAGQPHTVNCWFTANVRNGKESLLNNGKSTCSSAS
ncbi:ABC transporter substrate-binding protein [Frankia sp. R43]|uniref:ABC transporter substrate-binding protein n=1 Tax=Frankia sp. R43 TaxID=269536 RepID=UPI001F41C4A1|nr:ABC transporter substrate-binding protein [Frankia sp. R43]